MKLSLPVIVNTLVAIALLSTGCNTGNDGGKPAEVRIERHDNAYRLYVNDAEFFVKGAGGQEHLEKLANYGGNAIRTWSTDNAREILDEAHRHGLMVMLGLWVGHERHGFNYNDEDAVQAQLEHFTNRVNEFKDHPALLMWAIGNEMELNAANMKVWDAVNDIAKMIKDEDPNHPTMTVVAEISGQKIQYLQDKVPDIDLLGINSYGGLNSIPDRLRQFGWEKPYIVTEWGPNGHWEVSTTNWGAPIEQTSSEKAAAYKTRYEEIIAADTQLCLGSYVFLWGQKQERTTTWYGLFLDSGEETEAVDVMHFLWSGDWPVNRTPSVSSITINDRNPGQNIRIELGKVATGKVEAVDPDNDTLTYEWAITPESTDPGTGGDPELRPGEIEGLIIAEDNNGSVTFAMPEEAGPYRLFVYVFDGNGHAGTANTPFFVY